MDDKQLDEITEKMTSVGLKRLTFTALAIGRSGKPADQSIAFDTLSKAAVNFSASIRYSEIARIIKALEKFPTLPGMTAEDTRIGVINVLHSIALEHLEDVKLSERQFINLLEELRPTLKEKSDV